MTTYLYAKSLGSGPLPPPLATPTVSGDKSVVIRISVRLVFQVW